MQDELCFHVPQSLVEVLYHLIMHGEWVEKKLQLKNKNGYQWVAVYMGGKTF